MDASVIADIVQDGDEVAAAIKSSVPAVAGRLVHALRRVDHEAAAAVAKDTPALSDIGIPLDLLSSWDSAKCDPNTQAWFDSPLQRADAVFAIQVVATAITNAGCRFPASALKSVRAQDLRGGVTAMRLTNQSGADEIADLVRMTFAQHPSLPTSPALSLERLASFWRYLEIRECGDRVFRAAGQFPLDAAVAAARDCPDVAFEANLNPSTRTLELYLASGSSPPINVSRLDLVPQARALEFRPALDAMVEAAPARARTLLPSILRALASPEARIHAIRLMQRLGVSDPTALSITD